VNYTFLTKNEKKIKKNLKKGRNLQLDVLLYVHRDNLQKNPVG
jgi:hypothetical protein